MASHDRIRLIRPALIASKRTARYYWPVLERLLLGLRDESVVTILLCPTACDLGEFAPEPVEVIRYPVNRSPFLQRYNISVMADELERFKPNVLHCLDEDGGALAGKLAERLKLPWILTVNSLWPRGGCRSAVLRNPSRIIVPARSIFESLALSFPHITDRVEIINMGAFAASPVPVSNSGILKGILAASWTSACLRTNGSSRRRGIMILFGAARRLLIEGYEFMLAVVENEYDSHLGKTIGSFGLSHCVTVVPRLKAWRPMLAAANIFVRHEGLTGFDPLMLEAMACGCAVAGPRGGVDDLLVENETAAVFDPSSELSLTAALKSLLDRPEYAEVLAAGALGLVRKNHSVTGMINGLLSVYEQFRRHDV